MKNLKLIFAAFMMVFFTGCEEDLVKATLKSTVEANELIAPSVTTFVLTLDNKDGDLPKIEWTAPDFGFTASATYKLQIDLADNNFANAVELASTNSLSVTLKVGPTNDILLGLGLVPEEATSVELRVIATVNANVEQVVSNTIEMTLTSYATSFPPIYGMGAGLKGWGPWPANAVEWQSSEFKKYETVAYFTNGQAFRWFAQLDWGPISYNYPFFTSVSSVFENANDGDSNLKVAAASGWYKVNVNLAAKTVTAVPVDEPVMYMTGAGIGGWDQPGTGASIKMNYIKPGVFQADANFVSGQAWRFFAQANWGPISYNYPYFTSVPSYFENANDGDSNIKVVGASGTKKITVNIIEKTITLGDPPLPVLYMTGAGIGGWDKPGTGASIQMTYKSPGVFEATAPFVNGGAFRFFAQADWGPTSYNYPYFTTVHPDFENANDGDSNLKYIGASGSRKVTVNLTAKTVVLE